MIPIRYRRREFHWKCPNTLCRYGKIEKNVIGIKMTSRYALSLIINDLVLWNEILIDWKRLVLQQFTLGINENKTRVTDTHQENVQGSAYNNSATVNQINVFWDTLLTVAI